MTRRRSDITVGEVVTFVFVGTALAVTVALGAVGTALANGWIQ